MWLLIFYYWHIFLKGHTGHLSTQVKELYGVGTVSKTGRIRRKKGKEGSTNSSLEIKTVEKENLGCNELPSAKAMRFSGLCSGDCTKRPNHTAGTANRPPEGRAARLPLAGGSQRLVPGCLRRPRPSWPRLPARLPRTPPADRQLRRDAHLDSGSCSSSLHWAAGNGLPGPPRPGNAEAAAALRSSRDSLVLGSAFAGERPTPLSSFPVTLALRGLQGPS